MENSEKKIELLKRKAFLLSWQGSLFKDMFWLAADMEKSEEELEKEITELEKFLVE